MMFMPCFHRDIRFFFGSNPQEAVDLASIAYRSSSLSLIPAANAMDGFSISHMQSEVLLPEPELLKRYLGDPSERIPCLLWLKRFCSGPREGTGS